MKKNNIKLILFSFSIVISFSFLVNKSILPGFKPETSSRENIDLIRKVVTLINSEYIEEVNPSKTMNGAFKGLVNHLDILSAYLDEDDVIKYKQRRDHDMKDIGVILYKSYNLYPIIIGIKKNSPAEKVKLQIGDTISEINGQSTLLMSLSELYLRLKDKEKKEINLTIIEKNKTKEFKIKRRKLFTKPFSLSEFEKEGKIIKINHFFPPLNEHIKTDLIPQLKGEKGILVLDLRNCYEGDIEEASEFINNFLQTKKIGYIKNKDKKNQIISCPDKAVLSELKLVVWTNQATMGPSEIVAGVLKEFKKAKVIGHQTLGMTAQQELFPLEDGTGILLTSGIFYLASGKKLWATGIKPDIKINTETQDYKTYRKKTISLLTQ